MSRTYGSYSGLRLAGGRIGELEGPDLKLTIRGRTSARRKGPTRTSLGYCDGVGKAYNQMNGGSANGDAFVD